MTVMRAAATVILASLAVAGCGSAGDDGAAPPAVSTSSSSSAAPTTTTTTTTEAAPDATAVATRLKAAVKSVTKVVTITEDNDPNDKIGRPGGYVSAATLYDKGVSCDEIGADCGATVEVWADEASATQRSKFILETLKNADGVLGEEYHYQNGPVLLRVTGELKPSVAKQYQAAFSQ